MTNNSGKNLYMDWSKTNLCGHTPFDYVYAPTTENEQHVAVSQQGSEWFEAEAKCTGANLPMLVSPINGSDKLCTSGNYYISFCKAGNRSITWEVSNTGIATITGSGEQITLTKRGNGIITLTANISYPCSINGKVLTTKVSKKIIAGQQKPGPLTWTWDLPPGRVLLSVDQVPGALSYQWYLNGVLKETTTESVYRMPIRGNVSCENYYYFGVKAVGTCGTSEESYVYAEMPPCNFKYMVSPNPVVDYINIELTDETSISTNKKAAGIQRVKFYDKMGVLKLKYNFTTSQKTIKLSAASLPNDVYTLRIFDGETWQSSKIIIQH